MRAGAREGKRKLRLGMNCCRHFVQVAGSCYSIVIAAAAVWPAQKNVNHRTGRSSNEERKNRFPHAGGNCLGGVVERVPVEFAEERRHFEPPCTSIGACTGGQAQRPGARNEQ